MCIKVYRESVQELLQPLIQNSCLKTVHFEQINGLMFSVSNSYNTFLAIYIAMCHWGITVLEKDHTV